MEEKKKLKDIITKLNIYESKMNKLQIIIPDYISQNLIF